MKSVENLKVEQSDSDSKKRLRESESESYNESVKNC